MMAYYFCIDVGGTSIKSGVYDETGQLIRGGEAVNCQNTTSENHILTRVLDLIQHASVEYNLAGVAISSSGVIDPSKGQVAYAGYTIPNFQGTNYKKAVEERFGIRCEVENDVNAVLLAEAWQGNLLEKNNLVCLAIGTGIGGAIYQNGKLVRGLNYSAGEVGYLNVDGEFFQNLASTKALVQKAEEMLQESNLNGHLIMERGQAGDKRVLAVLDEWLTSLAKGISSLMYLLNPEMIILGGGIMEQVDFIKPRLEAKIQEQLISPFFGQSPLYFAKLGNRAGMVGALYHFLTNETSK